MNKIKCCIYKITSPSGKMYIGQTNDFTKRMVHYKNLLCVKQPKLFNSLKKYGFSNHKVEIICHCNSDELNRLEKYYVELYNTFNTTHGLNLKEGGGNKGKLSDETKRKLSEGRMGSKHHNFGKKASLITKKKLSDSHKGLIKTKEWREKLSAAHKGKKMHPSVIAASIKYHTGRTGNLCPNSKQIVQYSIDGEFIKNWECTLDVKREMSINPMNIGAVCRGERNQAGGFVWRFKQDDFSKFRIRKLGEDKKKKIDQFTKDGLYIKTWDSIKEASLFLNKNQSAISANCCGKVPSAYGFKWQFNI